MKVISGKYKGRKILGYDITGTRPTMDRVKESLFATIQDYIKDSIVLDLFAGSGALAIEALSMGAKYAYLNEKNNKACDIIKKNMNNIEINNFNLTNNDYMKALSYYKENNIVFNIIFLDPPYNSDYIEKSIDLINKYNLLEKNGIIVVESSYLNKIIYPNNYKIIKEKKYKDKWVVILK